LFKKLAEVLDYALTVLTPSLVSKLSESHAKNLFVDLEITNQSI
jgi:hypothetical protein